MKDYTIEKLFNLDETIAKEIFQGKVYPWEVLEEIGEYILKLGETLDPAEYEKKGKNVWIAKTAQVADSAHIDGPAIIGKEAQIRHCAFIRGNAIVGEGAVVGNSTELKNVILFNKVQVPHYNYVGDSVLGFHAHMGAGSICSNVKADNKAVVIHADREDISTGRRKVGAMLGDYADVGCGSVLNPGTVIGARTKDVYKRQRWGLRLQEIRLVLPEKIYSKGHESHPLTCDKKGRRFVHLTVYP